MEDIRGIINDLGEIRMKVGDITDKISDAAEKAGISADMKELAESAKSIRARAKTLAADVRKFDLRTKLGFREVPLGELRHENSRLLKHREWRGLGDTAYDFYYWLLNWNELIKAAKNNPKAMKKLLLRYRWMASYLAIPNFVDKNTEGMRGTALRTAHISYNMMVKNFATGFKFLQMADQNIAGPTPLAKRVIVHTNTFPYLLLGGFPTLIAMQLQVMPLFSALLMDQNIAVPYLAAIESYGVPADVCPMPEAEAGVAVMDDYSNMGACFLATNMVCDGSVINSQFLARRVNLPTFVMSQPLIYEEEQTQELAVAELRECIKFVEEITGESYNWDALRQTCQRFNLQTELEMNKWETNMTEYPQFTGSALWLFRMFTAINGAAKDPRYIPVEKKVDALVKRALEKKEVNVRKERRHRAIIWSCPANYYADFHLWLENCWGISGVMDMETHAYNIIIDTTSADTMLRDIARNYQRVAMRKHTNGGYKHALEELWELVERYNCDMVIMYNQMSCKGMTGLEGIYQDEARKRGIKMCWVTQDLYDPQTVSRRKMREDVNKFMTTVMQEEPLDPSLMDFDDSIAW